MRALVNEQQRKLGIERQEWRVIETVDLTAGAGGDASTVRSRSMSEAGRIISFFAR